MGSATASLWRCGAFLMAAMLIAVGLPVAAEQLGKADLERLLSESTEAFEAGNRLFATDEGAAQAEYEKATLRLERIIRDGQVENGKLYYNLGNIWYQRGNIGRSILNYLRAERYIPNNVNLQQNLAFVRQQRKDAFEPTEARKIAKTIFFWHYDLASGTRLRIFATCFLVFWGLAAARLYWRHDLLTAAIAGTGLLALLFFVSLTVEANYHRNHPRGVIVAPEVVARKGDGVTYQPSFAEPLHAGTEFTVEEDRGDWLLVALPDERTCWLPRADVGLVGELPGAGTAP